MKPWKKPIAPFPPTPPRVYKVDPINFRDLVQKLTGAPKKEPEPQPRLQRVAPPPLDLFTPTLFGTDREIAAVPLQPLPSPARTPLSSLYQELMYESLDAKPKRIPDSIMAVSSSIELNLSPSSYAWCSYPLLSPGTLSSLEQGSVL